MTGVGRLVHGSERARVVRRPPVDSHVGRTLVDRMLAPCNPAVRRTSAAEAPVVRTALAWVAALGRRVVHSTLVPSAAAVAAELGRSRSMAGWVAGTPSVDHMPLLAKQNMETLCRVHFGCPGRHFQKQGA